MSSSRRSSRTPSMSESEFILDCKAAYTFVMSDLTRDIRSKNELSEGKNSVHPCGGVHLCGVRLNEISEHSVHLCGVRLNDMSEHSVHVFGVRLNESHQE